MDHTEPQVNKIEGEYECAEQSSNQSLNGHDAALHSVNQKPESVRLLNPHHLFLVQLKIACFRRNLNVQPFAVMSLLSKFGGPLLIRKPLVCYTHATLLIFKTG